LSSRKADWQGRLRSCPISVTCTGLSSQEPGRFGVVSFTPHADMSSYRNAWNTGTNKSHGTIHLDFIEERLMRNRGDHSRLGRNDWHQRAAEFHDLAAHAHRVAAMRHGQEDHQTGRELSRQAMEYSARAHQYSQEAHEKSESSFSKAGKTVRIEPVKRANGVGKQSKIKA
jgi:hypothetical protein